MACKSQRLVAVACFLPGRAKDPVQFEEGCVTVCAETVDDRKDLNSGGRTCTYTYVYHCQNSVELNTFYVGTSKTPCICSVTTTSAFAIDSDVMHSSCWSVLVASVGTFPSLYSTSLDLYLSVYVVGAVNGIWLLDIHWALS